MTKAILALVLWRLCAEKIETRLLNLFLSHCVCSKCVVFLLLHCDFGAGDGSAGEVFLAAGYKFDHAVFGCVDGVVAAEVGAFAGDLVLADLADDDIAFSDGLATKYFQAEALAGTIVDVFTGTPSFYVTHLVDPYFFSNTSSSRATT